MPPNSSPPPRTSLFSKTGSLLLVVVLSSVQGFAKAEGEAAAQPVAGAASAEPGKSALPQAPLDAVVLEDGTLLRGAISERTPGERVVMVLLTGEVRVVPFAAVRYAGPASELPALEADTAPRAVRSESCGLATVASGT